MHLRISYNNNFFENKRRHHHTHKNLIHPAHSFDHPFKLTVCIVALKDILIKYAITTAVRTFHSFALFHCHCVAQFRSRHVTPTPNVYIKEPAGRVAGGPIVVAITESEFAGRGGLHPPLAILSNGGLVKPRRKTPVAMASNPWVATAANIALILTVIGSAWLVLDTGVGETWDVISGDTANVTAETNVTFGGAVGFNDRVVAFGAVMTILVGVGAVSAGKSQPKVVNQVIKHYPLLIGVIGVISFSAIVSEMINGSYDFDAFSDGQNALHVYITGAVLAAASTLLGMRK
jgi:hypothetical protein